MSYKQPLTRHTYYVEPTIRATEDWKTKQVKVTGSLGIAPNNHTIIEYPVCVWELGYWNKTNIRKAVTRVKRQLLDECAAIGYTTKDFTQPLKIKLFWEP